MPLSPLLSGGANPRTDVIRARSIRYGDEDWSRIGNLSPFWAMWNERRQAVGAGVISLPASGCDAQYMGTADPASPTDQFSVAAIQTWLETFATSFIRSHDDSGNEYGDGRFDQQAVGSIVYWTIPQLHAISATWLNNLGQIPPKSSTGFTRLRFNGASAIGVADGTEGDYFYHPLWNELYAFMRLLKWTLVSGSFDSHGENNSARTDSAFYDSWLDAYNDAAHQWPGTLVNTGDNPQALCLGARDGTTGQVQASLFRVYEYGEFAGIPTFTTHRMEVYQATEVDQVAAVGPPVGQYDANGDESSTLLFQQAKYRLIQSFSSANTATRTTGAIPPIARFSVPPIIAAEPPPRPAPFFGTQSQRGYECTLSPAGTGGTAEPQGVIKWDMVYD